MQSIFKPLLRPLPLLGISASSLCLAATLSTTTTKPATMSPNTNTNYHIQRYTPRHTTWPYTPSDFQRQDPSTDTTFYSSPRFVTHIDDAAIASLRAYYATVLPEKGRILDFCSSWISHYPTSIERAARAADGSLQITGMGLNAAELAANPLLTDRPKAQIVQDLNTDPSIYTALTAANAIDPPSPSSGSKPHDAGLLDASTCVVSIDYLTSPVAVLRSLRAATKVGGSVHLAISNRCFPTKAVARWLWVGEQERLLMVGDFLHFAGWRGIEIVEVSDGKVSVDEGASGEGAAAAAAGSNGLQGLFGWMGMGRRDPLWIVRAVKEDDDA